MQIKGFKKFIPVIYSGVLFSPTRSSRIYDNVAKNRDKKHQKRNPPAKPVVLHMRALP